MNKAVKVFAIAAATMVVASSAVAQDAMGGLLGEISKQVAGSDGESSASLSGRIIQMFLLMSVLSIAPGILVVATSFTRFVIVFSMLRSALGLNQSPPNMVINSLALFMTFFVMQPVFIDAYEGGIKPLLEDSISEEQALYAASEPFKRFMFVNVREQDLQLFVGMAKTEVEDADNIEIDEIGFRELIPAFMISELRKAFVIGFLIYLPFIVIDLVVASVLMSAGMMMLPPVMIALPFKVIIFVLLDGWYRLVGSLVESYVPVFQ